MSDQKPEPGMALEKIPPKDLKAWINSDQFKSALAQSLPSHMTAERYARICLTAMMRTPKLKDCTQASLFKAMLDCSSLGLEPDGRRAHLIPYDKKRNVNGKWIVAYTEAQLIIDYKGLVELMKRSGEVSTIRAELVCEKDEFSWENGIVTHKIDWRNVGGRGKFQCVYSHIKNKSGVDEYEVMTLDEVNAIRKRSKAGNDGPWVTDFNEMAKKTVIRRHSKKMTLSPEFQEALEKDADQFRHPDEQDSSFTLGDLMPVAQSEIDAAKEEQPEGAPGEADPETWDVPGAEPVKVDPESPVCSDSLMKILKVFQDAKMPKERLDDFLNSVIGAKSINNLKEKEVERVCAWIKNQSSTK